MALANITSPHAHSNKTTSWVMFQVILAMVPGIAALTIVFGYGNLINAVFASIMCVGFEALFVWLRRRPITFYIRDGSAIVTGMLIGISFPPYAPFWVIVIASCFAIMLVKHLYGGMGYNPFNPAMSAYVVMQVSLPVYMTQWAAPLGVQNAAVQSVGFMDALKHNFTWRPYLEGYIDSYTMATPLDILKQNESLTLAELHQQYEAFGMVGGLGWEWVNLAFLVGGCYLLARRIFTWHAPVAMLLALALLSLINYQGGGSDSGGSVLFHLFSGATMVGAFFIVTDPVTSATSNYGRFIYGFCIGVLVYIIRVWGGFPEALAFAVLLMNFCAPLIDQYTRPKTYGHGDRS